MRLAHEVTVDAPPEDVFAFVSDLARTARCLPGARVEESNGDEHRAAMRVKVGPIVANYAGTLRFVELDPGARRAVLHARADETAGSGQAEARIETAVEGADGGSRSRIRIDTDLQIRGRVAQFGRGAIESVARRLLAEFAGNLERALAGAPEPGPPARPAEPGPGRAAPPAAELDALGLLAGESGARLLRALLPALVGLGYGYLLGRLSERRARARRR